MLPEAFCPLAAAGEVVARAVRVSEELNGCEKLNGTLVCPWGRVRLFEATCRPESSVQITVSVPVAAPSEATTPSAFAAYRQSQLTVIEIV